MRSPGTKHSKWRRAAVPLFALLALLAAGELLFGRLVPFSPVVVGFSRLEGPAFVVYHHRQPEASRLSFLGDVISLEEAYHGLRFTRKPEVFLCRNDAEFRRLTGGRARFNAINGRLFVSGRAQEDARRGTIDLRTYLTHELSHVLLQQHMSVPRALRMPRWLLEGTAMDCAGQVGVGIYPARTAVYEAVARGVFCEPDDFGTSLRGERGTALSCPVENRAAFIYSEFGCLVGFLRSSRGAENYRAFLRDVTEGPHLDVEKSFEKTCGATLREEIARFRAAAQGR